MLYENTPTARRGLARTPAAFVAETDRIFDLLGRRDAGNRVADDSQTLTYLHRPSRRGAIASACPKCRSISTRCWPTRRWSAAWRPCWATSTCAWCRCGASRPRPGPGILDDLNRLGFAYRWSPGSLPGQGRGRKRSWAPAPPVVRQAQERHRAAARNDLPAGNPAGRYRRQQQGRRRRRALQELGSDQRLRPVTAGDGADADPAKADEKLRMVERVIQGRGFVTIPETLNAVDAWLSSIPRHAYANVRQPIVSTLNLAHMMPVSAVWAGTREERPPDGPPLIVTRTDGATPFRLVTHVGDVGHTLVAGRPAWQSVLLATLAMQFRRYPARASSPSTWAARSGRPCWAGRRALRPGRGWFEIAFQPLARIDRGATAPGPDGSKAACGTKAWRSAPDERRPSGRRSAAGQCAGGAAHDDRPVGPAAIERAAPGIAPYVLGGAHGKLLDADHDRLGMPTCSASRWRSRCTARPPC